ncbi:MAG: tyrosine-type recombinase/integrase [Actinomycetota bacterium]
MADLLDSWRLSLEAGNRAPKTVATYTESGRSFVEFLERAGLPAEATSIERGHVEAWMVDLAGTRQPSTVSVRYRALRQFWKWATGEREVEHDPMANISPPIVPEQPVPVLTLDEVRSLLKACDGASFDERRDNAIISLLFDTGLRRAEIAGLTVDAVDFQERVVRVVGKGRRPRVVPFGTKSAQRLDRYRRSRNRHPHAALAAFWLGQRGPLTDSGFGQIIEKRAKDAGLGKVHTHQLRHSFAHMWLAGGGAEGDLMELAGWKSRQMLTRYASSTRSERARDAHRTYSPGDRV